MLAIEMASRGIAVALCALVGTLALADGDIKGSPTDLEWLRAEVGDGALIHHSDGRIYLTELATAESVLVGNGNQPEFSPDGTKFAWIDGTAAGSLASRGLDDPRHCRECREVGRRPLAVEHGRRWCCAWRTASSGFACAWLASSQRFRS